MGFSASMAASNASLCLLLSGGLDSAILLVHLLRQGRTVQPFYVRSRLAWEEAEYGSLQRFLAAVQRPGLAELIVFEMPLDDLYGDHWSVTGKHVPDDTSPDEAVYLPGRNPLLLIKPAVWCQLHGVEELALALLGTNPFPDATPQFFASYSKLLNQATQGKLQIVCPFGGLHKREVMELACDCPLHLTFSCIAPRDGKHCGRCNKCAERQTAFRLIGGPDPTQYAG